MFNPRPNAPSIGSEKLLGFWLAVMVIALGVAFFYSLVLFFILVVVFLLLGIFVRLGAKS